jgi:hypothetical protein
MTRPATPDVRQSIAEPLSSGSIGTASKPFSVQVA